MKSIYKIFTYKALCLALLTAAVAACSCTKKSATPRAEQPVRPEVHVPEFNADSAFAFVAKQVQFGPRVPGTPIAEACGDWLVQKLTEYGASNITEQRTTVVAYNGDKLPIRNISAQYNPDANRRILLLAHWDTRPWADQETNPADRERPIDGANDGASGVGVILELARLFSMQQPRVGVDILLVDAEDYGQRADKEYDGNSTDTWALGTQHWIQEPTLDISQIDYAILFDLVGGRDAKFHREYFSQSIAPAVNDKIWREAAGTGFGQKFIDAPGGAIVDDHVYLARIGIKAVDIIENMSAATGSFPATWHKHADNIDNIDPASLKAAGQVAANVIYKE